MARTARALGCAVICASALLVSAAPAGALLPAPESVSVSPAPGSPFDAGFRPDDIAAGDVNGDGRDDVVTVNGSNPGRVSVLLSLPDGSLQETAASPIPTNAGEVLGAIDMADLNRDGKLDVVGGTNADPGQVVVLLGDGAGGFSPTAQSPVSVNSPGHYPIDLHVVDLTGDGLLDVITANYQTNEAGFVSVLEGDGAGGLTMEGTQLVSGDDHIYDVAAVDLNGDARLDLASLHYNPDGLRVRINTPIGFGAPSALIDAGPAAGRIALGDLDLDGDQDLAFANQIGNSDITALQNDGDGSPGDLPGFPVETGAQYGFDIAVRDVDADGMPDIASAHDLLLNTDVTLSLIVATGGGAFSPVAGSPFATGGARATSLAVGDFNGDAQPDFATADQQDTGKIAVLLNGNAGNAVPSTTGLDFGSVAEGTQAQGLSVGFTNSGSGFSRLGPPTISGPAAGDFGVGENGCADATLLKAVGCSLAVTFRPTDTGERTATLTVVDTPGGTRTISLRGVGLDVTDPVVSGLRLSRKRFKVGRKPTARSAAKAGTSIRFRLSEPADVRIELQRALPGRRSRGRCVKPRRGSGGKRCTRYVKRGTLRRDGAAGANSVAFSGRVGRKALRRGRYRLALTASDAAGNSSPGRPARFRIVRR